MIGTGRYTTLLLVVIVIILLFGVGIALYFVLDLDWFNKEKVTPYVEQQPVTPYKEVEVKENIQVSLDMTKRTYDILVETDELKVIVYKDGTVGITMLENEKYRTLTTYSELLNKEVKSSLKDIVKVYSVKVSKDNIEKDCIILLDKDGNMYKLVESVLISEGKYAFVKIEGIAKIVDIKQITNNYLVENTNGINLIAIDYEGNELLITDYLLKD